jgi:predicted PolB exonuclease-like 3'-5' exonuclease
MSTNRVIAFDIETIARPGVADLLPPIEPRANLKDPMKIEADIREKEEKRKAELGLNPATNMTVCFAWCDGDGNSGAPMIITPNNKKVEKGFLEDVWGILNRYNKFITFNGNNFDVPCLYTHSLINRVRPAVRLSTRKYPSIEDNHIDLRAVLNNGNQYASGKFDFWLKLILGEDAGKTEGVDGSQIQGLFELGKFEVIQDYAVNDAEQLWKLWEVVRDFYLV